MPNDSLPLFDCSQFGGPDELAEVKEIIEPFFAANGETDDCGSHLLSKIRALIKQGAFMAARVVKGSLKLRRFFWRAPPPFFPLAAATTTAHHPTDDQAPVGVAGDVDDDRVAGGAVDAHDLEGLVQHEGHAELLQLVGARVQQHHAASLGQESVQLVRVVGPV